MTTVLGFAAESKLGDPALFQGAITLGGAWIICGFFTGSKQWYWHGLIAAGVLALLGAARCAPAVLALGKPDAPAAPYQAAALVIAFVVLVSTVRTLRAERARRQLEELQKEDED
ncbi:hypothetical protein [Haloferula rosea]|uniref:Uncharacterized protein n=1 Tax=Haloferula rosea TaxID=490093 RepID=A0A934VFY3_9BACT|nr:hypothetical protein [Haloferula rosea]MBK1827060.1 hypothetical protein [Haloferula rosea]